MSLQRAIFLSLGLCLGFFSTSWANELLIMNYNVEHLMDYQDDPDTMDDEYTPFGSLNWDETKFKEKVDRIVLAIMDHQQTGYFGLGPDIIVLQEIENRFVLQALMDGMNRYLVKNDSLAKHYNEIVHFDSEDYVGIEVGMISRVPMVTAKAHRVHRRNLTWYYKRASEFYDKEIYSTVRDVLEARFQLKGVEFIVLGNHWPAQKKGGTAFDAVKRFMVAQATLDIVKQRLTQEEKIDIIITGDFNSDPENVALTNGLHAIEDKDQVRASTADDPLLYNLNYSVYNFNRLSKTFYNSVDRFVAAFSTTGKWQLSVFDEVLKQMYDKPSARLALREYETKYQGRLVKAALSRLKKKLFNNLTQARGTFWFAKFQRWQTLDSIILSRTLFDRTGLAIKSGSYKVLDAQFLQDPEGLPYGYSKCFWDLKNKGCMKNDDGTVMMRKGYSDHYPIIARFRVYPQAI